MSSFKHAFFVSPNDVMFRIFASFVPPIGNVYSRIHLDLVGPSLGLLLLTALTNYGYGLKGSTISLGPNEFLLLYCLLVPSSLYSLTVLGQTGMDFSEIVSLLGYGLFGHLFTLATSFVCFQEESNAFFFVALVLFSGTSTLRMMLIVLKTIPKHGLRLIVCSTLAIVQILSLIFIHFAYMHKTYRYRNNINAEF